MILFDHSVIFLSICEYMTRRDNKHLDNLVSMIQVDLKTHSSMCISNITYAYNWYILCVQKRKALMLFRTIITEDKTGKVQSSVSAVSIYFPLLFEKAWIYFSRNITWRNSISEHFFQIYLIYPDCCSWKLSHSLATLIGTCNDAFTHSYTMVRIWHKANF